MTKDNNGNGKFPPNLDLDADNTLPTSPPPSPPSSSRRPSDEAPNEEPPLPPEGQDDLTPEEQDDLPPIPVDLQHFPPLPISDEEEATQSLGSSSNPVASPSQNISDQKSWEAIYKGSIYLDTHKMINPVEFDALVAFCKGESSPENVTFLIQYEQYERRRLFGNPKPDDLKNAFQDICQNFIGGVLETTIPEETKVELRKMALLEDSASLQNIDGEIRQKLELINRLYKAGDLSPFYANLPTKIQSELAKMRPTYLNLPDKAEKALVEIYQGLNSGNLLPEYLLNNDVFLGVVTDIRALLVRDTYGRFKQTEKYKEAPKASMRDIAVNIFDNRKFVAHCLDDKGRQKLHMVGNQQTLTAKGEAEEAKIISKALQGRAMEVTNSLPIGLYREFARDWDEALQSTISHLPSARDDNETASERLVPNFLAFHPASGKFCRIQRSKKGDQIKAVPLDRDFERRHTALSVVKSGEKKYNSISDLRNGGYEIYELCEDQFLYSLLSKFVSRPLEFQHSKFSEITEELPLGSYITSKDQNGKSTIAILVGPDPEKPKSGNRIVSIKDSRGVTVLTEPEKAELLRYDSDVYIPQVTSSNQSFIDNYTSTIAGLIGKGVQYDSGKERSSERHRGSVFSREKPDHWTKSLAKFYSYKEANDNGFVSVNHLKTHAAALFTFAMQKAAFDSIGEGFSGFHRIGRSVDNGEFTTRLESFKGSGAKRNEGAVVSIFEAWYKDNRPDIEDGAEQIHHGFKKPASHTNIATFVQNILGVVDISLTEETLKKQGGKEGGVHTTTSTNSSERSDTGGAGEESGSITEGRRPRFGVFGGMGRVPETPRGGVPAASPSSRGPAVRLQEEGQDPKTPRGGRG